MEALDALRARVRELEGVHGQVRREPTGVTTLDEHLGGLPRPGLIEICGAPGSGRTRVALAVLAAATERGEVAAWVDLARDLYPPSLSQHGVRTQRVLVVRPTQDRSLWAVEQLLRSGCFPQVVVTGLSSVGRAGYRWARAVEHGRCTALLIRDQPDRRIPATMRLSVAEDQLLVTRDRTGQGGPRSSPLPPAPLEGDFRLGIAS